MIRVPKVHCESRGAACAWPGHFHMQHNMNASVYNIPFSSMLNKVVYMEQNSLNLAPMGLDRCQFA